MRKQVSWLVLIFFSVALFIRGIDRPETPVVSPGIPATKWVGPKPARGYAIDGLRTGVALSEIRRCLPQKLTLEKCGEDRYRIREGGRYPYHLETRTIQNVLTVTEVSALARDVELQEGGQVVFSAAQMKDYDYDVLVEDLAERVETDQWDGLTFRAQADPDQILSIGRQAKVLRAFFVTLSLSPEGPTEL